jgi:glycosyltransferase involved in cell wall biosynthesis
MMELNELNQNANGGTELVTRGLLERISPEEFEGVQLITSRVRELKKRHKRILHLHDLAGDPEVQHLKSDLSRNRFSKLVFCSNWQYESYRNQLGVPWDDKSTVIANGIEPLNLKMKPTDKIRLIYTSTPHRGLEILVPVFEHLYKQFDGQIELDVFSSFNIYGWPERDAPYEELFERCRQHPGINYHGFQPNSVVRGALEKAHIFAYPSIWQETFCIALAEAMSAGCLCVHPNLAALPETSGGLTVMYDGNQNPNEHAQVFAHTLAYAIENIRQNDMTPLLRYIKSFADTRYSWTNVIYKWQSLLNSLK